MKQPTDKMLLEKYNELLQKRQFFIDSNVIIANCGDLDDSLAYIDRNIERLINKIHEYGKDYLLQ